TVTATFTTIAPSCYALTANASPSGSGTASANTTQNCAGGYTSTTQVAISATPTSGYQFSSWSATNCTLANPNQASTTCTMTGGAAVVNANFNQIGGVQACASYSISPTTVNPGASAGS